jgi:pyridoxamine 5'-phosphate oxidase
VCGVPGVIIAHVADGVADIRRDYRSAGSHGLRRADLAADWTAQFRDWLAAAVAEPTVLEPTAMVLATATPDGVPSARTVLLKGIAERGFSFFTNLNSRKGTEIAANPRVCLVFPWYPLERQVVVTGTCVPLPRHEVEAYAQSRPRGSQLSAWASPQSEAVPDRDDLERRRREVASRWPEGPVPTPPFWGGFCVEPDSVEFWQGRPDRLHDRLRYRRQADGGWVVERLGS